LQVESCVAVDDAEPQVFASSHLAAGELDALLGRAVDQRARIDDASPLALDEPALISRTRSGAPAGRSSSAFKARCCGKPSAAEGRGCPRRLSDRRSTTDRQSDAHVNASCGVRMAIHF
jgi:hypothetical protein